MKHVQLMTLLLGSVFLCISTFSQAEQAETRRLHGLCGGVAVDDDGLLRIDELERLLETNPYISGVLLMAKWDTLEPEPEKFEWDNLDEAIALARKHNRFYKLKIQPGTSTPKWVYSKGAVPFETKGSNPYRKDTYKKPLYLPIPWDSVYLSEFDHLISAIGDRYADDPYCAGIVITGANYQSGESHLPKEPEDKEKWDKLNYQDHLAGAYERIIDIWAEAFPRQQLCLHVSVPISRSDGILDKVIEEAAKIYPDRFTLQNCQLSGKKDNISLYSYGLIQEYTDRLHVGYQSLAYIGSERQGDTSVSIYNYVRGKGEYWELWRGNALDVDLCKSLRKEIDQAREMGIDAYRESLTDLQKKILSEGITN